jgi:putative toxin-antitoxin system antitoxin component (TIGR02293 family)
MESSSAWLSAGQEAILSIAARAGEVFSNRQKALRWLHSPNPALGGLTPLDAVETSEGRQEVEDILGRIENGIIG